ncbi:MAG: helix-turn-helix transcriptional regulator, partial [Patescibacteria group bacterium]|nr:helix-turn-helix transcriptional regulator [Patescibacteria group bacterium]
MPLSTLVREMREAAGLTQEQLSHKSGVGITTVRKIEQGDTPNPTSITLIMLARACDGSLDTIGEKLEAEGFPG